MLTKTIVTAAVAGGLAFGIAVPAQAASASECSIDRVLVSAAVQAAPAVYGDAPLLTEAQEAWIERVLVSPAIDEVSHLVRHEAVYTPRVVIDQPFVAAVPPVDEVSRVVHHAEVTETIAHAAITKQVVHEAVMKTVHHEAVTKTVHHSAETSVVRHPAVTKTVHHDAVTKTVHHETVTHTEYTRYSWVGGGRGPAEGNTPLTSPKDWNANSKKYDGSSTGVVLQQGQGNASYFYWSANQVVDQKAYDETVVVTAAWDETVVVTAAWDEKVVTPAWDETVVVAAAWDEKVVVTPAWDETVVVAAAWDEKVVVTPARDEKIVVVEASPGTPEHAEISHLEYDLLSEARDETVVDVEAQDAVYAEIVHSALPAVLGEPILISPAIDARPAVFEDVETCVSAEGVDVPEELPLTNEEVLGNTASDGAPSTLALTGGGVNPMLPVAGVALLAGGVALFATRRSRRDER